MPGSPNRGLQADSPKPSTVYCCTMQFHRELGQKSIFSTTEAMVIFRIFTHKFDKFPRGLLRYRIVSLFSVWSCVRRQSDRNF